MRRSAPGSWPGVDFPDLRRAMEDLIAQGAEKYRPGDAHPLSAGDSPGSDAEASGAGGV